MRPFEYIAPPTAAKAVSLLYENSPNAKPVAGGTDLVVEMKHAPGNVKILVDVSQIPELKGIELTADGLRIGSMVTHTSIMKSPLIKQHAPAMIDAAHTVGAVQTRNLGTLGGNLVTCVPSMDSGPTLQALDALMTVKGPDGQRQMTLDEFFVGPRKTVLQPHEILVDIVIPKANLGKPTCFVKFGLRKGQALALVNVAASLRIDPITKKISEPRISLGAVAPTVMRATKAEELLSDKEASTELFAEAAEIAVTECKPIDDFRASANYRRQLVKVLTRRALEDAYNQTQPGSPNAQFTR